MSRIKMLTITTMAIMLCVAVAFPANAQSLSAKVTGAWTLVSGSENYSDGKKNMPWATGNLILDSNGHFSQFLVGKDQPKTSPSPRTPVGPFVAYYGTYTVDEANSMYIMKVDHGASPLQNGATRTQKVSFNGDIMTLTASEVKTPEGTMIPVNVWQRAK